MSRRQVGTGHLLLGLLGEPGELAARAIVALGVTPAQIRELAGASPVPAVAAADESSTPRLPHTRSAAKAVELSLRAAMELGGNGIGTEHLLLGLLAEGKDEAARILTRLGITRDRAMVWIAQ